MVNAAGSCVMDSVSVNYCPVSLFETWYDGSHTCLLQTHSMRDSYVCLKPKKSLRMCPSARMVHWEDSVGVCQGCLWMCECVVVLTNLWHEAVQTPLLSQSCLWPHRRSCHCPPASGHWWSARSNAVSSGRLREVGDHLSASAQSGSGIRLLCRGARCSGPHAPRLLGNCPGSWVRTRWGLEGRGRIIFFVTRRGNLRLAWVKSQQTTHPLQTVWLHYFAASHRCTYAW